MALPVLKHPVYQFHLVSSERKVSFRPMLVGEEKILLTAAESPDVYDSRRAVIQVLEACSQDALKGKEIFVPDVEWLFLQLRSVSISNVIAAEYEDSEDQKTYPVKFEIEEVEPPALADSKFFVKVGDVTIEFSWPTGETFVDSTAWEDQSKLVARCVRKVFGENEVYGWDSPEELEEWIKQIPLQEYAKVVDYLNSMPTITHDVSFTNSKGTERKFTLRGLKDFFGLA